MRANVASTDATIDSDPSFSANFAASPAISEMSIGFPLTGTKFQNIKLRPRFSSLSMAEPK